MQDSHIQTVFPIIFDDSSDQGTDVRLGHGSVLDEGLLAKADAQTVLLSMSNYGKSQNSDSKGKSRSVCCFRPAGPKSFIAIGEITTLMETDGKFQTMSVPDQHRTRCT